MFLFATALPAAAQIYQCTGRVNGVESQSVIQLEERSDTVYVSGVIQNPRAYYSFNGEMFGKEGFIALTDNSTGERRDQVHIALTDSGYAIQPEGGAPYDFSCH